MQCEHFIAVVLIEWFFTKLFLEWEFKIKNNCEHKYALPSVILIPILSINVNVAKKLPNPENYFTTFNTAGPCSPSAVSLNSWSSQEKVYNVIRCQSVSLEKGKGRSEGEGEVPYHSRLGGCMFFFLKD